MQTQRRLFDDPALVAFSSLPEIAASVLVPMQRAVLDAVSLFGNYRRNDPNFVGDEIGQYEAAQFLHPWIIRRVKTALASLEESGDVRIFFRKRIFAVRFRNVARFCIKKVDHELRRGNIQTAHNQSFWTQRPDDVLKVLFAYKLSDDMTKAKTYLILPDGSAVRDWIAYPDQSDVISLRAAEHKNVVPVSEPRQKGFRVKPRKDATEKRRDAGG